MSLESAISEQLLSTGPEQTFTNNCLKRKLEVAGRNGFSATVDHDMGFQDHDCSPTSEVGAFDFENFYMWKTIEMFTRYHICLRLVDLQLPTRTAVRRSNKLELSVFRFLIFQFTTQKGRQVYIALTYSHFSCFVFLRKDSDFQTT